jgi:hypothetical protein
MTRPRRSGPRPAALIPGRPRALRPSRSRRPRFQDRQDQRDDMLAVELERAAALARLELGRQPVGRREERSRLVDVAAPAADHPAEYPVLWNPRDVRHRLLPRVLGAPDVTASADGSPQRGKVQLERNDVPMPRTISPGPVNFAPDMPGSSEPVRSVMRDSSDETAGAARRRAGPAVRRGAIAVRLFDGVFGSVNSSCSLPAGATGLTVGHVTMPTIGAAAPPGLKVTRTGVPV